MIGSHLLTIEMLHFPLSFGAFWDDLKSKRRSIRICILIIGIQNNSILSGAYNIGITGQDGAVVIQIFNLDGYGTSGCFTRHVCDVKTEMLIY